MAIILKTKVTILWENKLQNGDFNLFEIYVIIFFILLFTDLWFSGRNFRLQAFCFVQWLSLCGLFIFENILFFPATKYEIFVIKMRLMQKKTLIQFLSVAFFLKPTFDLVLFLYIIMPKSIRLEMTEKFITSVLIDVFANWAVNFSTYLKQKLQNGFHFYCVRFNSVEFSFFFLLRSLYIFG